MSQNHQAEKTECEAGIAELSFEEALRELDAIVKALETGKEPLESAIAKYERGSALKTHCERKLKEAKLKIDLIMKQDDGSITTSPAKALEEEN